MKKSSKTIAIVTIAAVLAISLVALPTFAQYRRGLQGMSGMQSKQGALFMRGLRFLKDLDLTQAQKDQIKAVFEKHKADIAVAIKEYVKARMALNDAIWDNSNYQAAFLGLTQAEKNGLVLRVAVHKEIMDILTADQIKQLEEKRNDIKTHINQRLNRLGAR
jgi:Spy/CpxP family protein refolding chaperone